MQEDLAIIRNYSNSLYASHYHTTEAFLDALQQELDRRLNLKKDGILF